MTSLILYSVLLAVSEPLPQTDFAVLAGRLTFAQGEAAAGVRVVAVETSYPRMDIPSQAETDSNGRYRLENVPPGEYFIVADPFNSPSYYPGVGNRDNAKSVSVVAGAVANLDFKFVRSSGVLRTLRAPGATKFSGILRNTTSQGLPNITVSLFNGKTSTRLWSVTNASGSFEFLGLAAGEFSLETFSPVQKHYEEVTEHITLRDGESLQEEIGLRILGNFQQRPDLYAKADVRQTEEKLRNTGPPEPIFRRCQKSDLQPSPQYPQMKGSVALMIRVDSDGKLLWIRTVSPDANPDLARAAVDAVSHWSFTPIKFTRDEMNRQTYRCDGDGEAASFQGTVTFNFPAD